MKIRKGRRVTLFLLTLAIVWSCFPAYAHAAFDKSSSDVAAWVSGFTEGVGYEGDGLMDRYINGVLYNYSYQCVDFTKLYMKYLDGRYMSGNAGQYASIELYPGYNRIQKYDGFVPAVGDILIWKGNPGHVAIVTAVNNAHEVVYSDQNGAGSTKKMKHGRIMDPASNDYWGVIRPDLLRTLDVNGYLDGKAVDNIYDYGTFDLWLNDKRAKNDAGDYWEQRTDPATRYAIRDVKAASGKVFAGFRSGAYAGTVNEDKTVVMEFRTLNPSKWVKNHTPAKTATFGGHTYQYFQEQVTWLEALYFCTKLGGHPVSIESAAENAFVNELAGKNSVWLGATDMGTEGRFIWYTLNGMLSAQMPYTNWAKGEPNDDKSNAEGGEDYAMMIGSADDLNGKWNDIYGYAQYGFVCEIDRDDMKYTLDVNGLVDGASRDILSGVATFDYSVKLKGEAQATTVSGVNDYYHTQVPSGSTYTFYNIKPAAGYEYVGQDPITGTVNGNTTVMLEFRKKVDASFTFRVDQSKYQVGETWAQIGYFKIYSNIDLGTVKTVGCELYDANGNFLARDEEEAYVVGDHLTHYFHISGDANEQDIRYKLTPGTKYKLRMYVLYNGKKHCSTWQIFTTAGTAPTSKPTATATPKPTATATPKPTATVNPAILTTTGPGGTLQPIVAPTPAGARKGTILHCANAVNVRAEASSNSRKLGTVQKLQKVTVLEQVGKWCRIEFAGGTGYVYSKYVAIHHTGTIVGVNKSVTVRQTPAEDGAKLGTIRKGKTVEVIEIDGDWAMIVYKSGVAYIHSKFVQLED